MSSNHSSKMGLGDAEVIPCRLCRRPYRRITGSHLYWKHQLETCDYRDRFPNEPFFATENRRALSRSIVRAWERLGRHWTRERVRRAIRDRRARGRELHSKGVKDRSAALYTAGMRIYGSWDLALKDAGVSPGSVRRRKTWTEAELRRALKDASASGTFRKGARFKRHHPALIQAAAYRWGSWSKALRAVGLRPLRPPPVRWTRREVVRRILERHRRGETLLAAEVSLQASALKRAAVRLYGKPWSDVVRELGFQYEGRRRWGPAQIVRELRRLADSGASLRPGHVQQTDRALALAAFRWFGGWRPALEAAGIDPGRAYRRHWTKGELRALFRRLRRSGGLTRRGLRAVSRAGLLQPLSSAKKHWGTLEAALKGLS